MPHRRARAASPSSSVVSGRVPEGQEGSALIAGTKVRRRGGKPGPFGP
jgi:hypothetical protein